MALTTPALLETCITQKIKTTAWCRTSGDAIRKNARLVYISISERPAEVEDRAIPGHWEGDLLSGLKEQSHCELLAERHLHFYLALVKVPKQGHGGGRRCTEPANSQTPNLAACSLTWDRGSDMAANTRPSRWLQTWKSTSVIPTVPAARHERKHQPAAATIPPQQARPVPAHAQSELDSDAGQGSPAFKSTPAKAVSPALLKLPQVDCY